MSVANFWSTWRVSCDWACHIARGSAGGTDYAVSVGTPVRASFDGVLTNRLPVRFPASGNVAILTRSDGLAFYHCHLSQFVTPGPVSQGDIIGYSGGALGAPGSGSSTGPHLHVNAFIGSTVRDVHDFFTSTAGIGGTPILVTPSPKEQDMAIYELMQTPDGTVWFVVDRVTRYGIPDVVSLESYKAFIVARGQNPAIIGQGNPNAWGSPVFVDGSVRVQGLPQAPIDTAALAAAIAAKLNVSGTPAAIDVAAIAAAVDAALVDNFAKIPTHFTITGEAK